MLPVLRLPVPTTESAKNEEFGAVLGSMPPSESNATADSRELLLQILHATNLLQLLHEETTATQRGVSARENYAYSALSCAGIAGDHRQSDDKWIGTARSPLVPGTAHKARPHTCPCGVSARAEKPSHTHTRKAGKKISLSR